MDCFFFSTYFLKVTSFKIWISLSSTFTLKWMDLYIWNVAHSNFADDLKNIGVQYEKRYYAH